jgi:hypothetical protein
MLAYSVINHGIQKYVTTTTSHGNTLKQLKVYYIVRDPLNSFGQFTVVVGLYT